MRRSIIATAILLASLAAAGAQPYQMPPDADRCPSRWGAGDERGSANWVKPETILRATKLIKTGEMSGKVSSRSQSLSVNRCLGVPARAVNQGDPRRRW